MRQQGPTFHALPVRAWSLLGGAWFSCKHFPVPGCRRGYGAVDPALGRCMELCKLGVQGQPPPFQPLPQAAQAQPAAARCRVCTSFPPPRGIGRGGMKDTVHPKAGIVLRVQKVGVVPSGLSSPAGSTQSPGCHAGQKSLCIPLNQALPAKLPPPRSPTCPLAGRKIRGGQGP